MKIVHPFSVFNSSVLMEFLMIIFFYLLRCLAQRVAFLVTTFGTYFSKYSYKCTGGLSFGAISVGRLYAANPHEQEGYKISIQYLLVLLLLEVASSLFSIYAANNFQQEGFKSKTNYVKVIFPNPIPSQRGMESVQCLSISFPSSL